MSPPRIRSSVDGSYFLHKPERSSSSHAPQRTSGAVRFLYRVKCAALQSTCLLMGLVTGSEFGEGFLTMRGESLMRDQGTRTEEREPNGTPSNHAIQLFLLWAILLRWRRITDYSLKQVNRRTALCGQLQVPPGWRDQLCGCLNSPSVSGPWCATVNDRGSLRPERTQRLKKAVR